MTELFRFWRTLPRASLGLVFLTAIALLATGPLPLEDAGDRFGILRETIGEATTGVLLTLGVIAAASLGAEFSRNLILPLRFIGGRLFIALGRAEVSGWRRAAWILGASPVKLAVQLFQTYRKFFYDFYFGWSSAVASTPEMYEIVKRDWDTHFKLLEGVLIEELQAPQELSRVALFTSVTQEQALAEYMESTLESMQLAWVTLALSPVLAFRFGADVGEIWMVLVCAIVIALALVPMYVRRKLTLAVFLVYSHCVAFQFGELAENADRETV